MNSSHKLFFILLLSTPTIILTSDTGTQENTVMYPNQPVTEIEPLDHLPNQNRSTVSEADVQAWQVLLARQQQNIKEAAAKTINDLVNAAEPASVPMSPAGKPLSPKNNRK